MHALQHPSVRESDCALKNRCPKRHVGQQLVVTLLAALTSICTLETMRNPRPDCPEGATLRLIRNLQKAYQLRPPRARGRHCEVIESL